MSEPVETDTPANRRLQVVLAGHRADVETVRRFTADPDWIVRASMLRALHRCQSLEIEDLSQALGDDRPEVRGVAAELAAASLSPSLLASLDDPDARVVEVACWASGERDPVEIGAVERLVEIAGAHGDALCRESAIAALGAIGHRDGLPAVLAGLDDKPAVRRRSVVALAAFDGPAVDAALERARHDRDRQVREAVDELLGPT